MPDLWSLLTATVVYRCTCMCRRFLLLNFYILTTDSLAKWSSSVQCGISSTTIYLVSLSFMNNENKAYLKHAECLILLQQDDNEDGTNFIHIFVFAYNLLWCHPKVSFYHIPWNTHFSWDRVFKPLKVIKSRQQRCYIVQF